MINHLLIEIQNRKFLIFVSSIMIYILIDISFINL